MNDAVALAFARWLAALEARHLADLRLPEVARALRALSSAYVERRARGDSPQRVQGALDSAGKRAAFALFYGPLHFLTVSHVVQALGATPLPRTRIVDLGCGTGAAGAAWALSSGGSSKLVGLDRHPWAVTEARWTYRQLGLRGTARQSDITTPTRTPMPAAFVAGWTLNELGDERRARLERQLLEAAERGSAVLILEPIARAISPWWAESAARMASVGGRAEEWRFPVELPSLLKRLDTAAGLDHRELKVRTLYIGARS